MQAPGNWLSEVQHLHHIKHYQNHPGSDMLIAHLFGTMWGSDEEERYNMVFCNLNSFFEFCS